MKLKIEVSQEVLELASTVAKDVVASLGYHDSKPSFEWYLSVAAQVQRLLDVGGKTGGDLRRCKILEIGSGMGMFVCVANKLGIECCGLTPSFGAYSSQLLGARKLLSYNEVSSDCIIDASGENIPFEENEFDIVVCFDVLEHVQNPDVLLTESLRVLKPGGHFYSTSPSCARFWEYHYAIPWLPCMPKWFANYWVRAFRRNPEFLNEMNLINPWKLKKWLTSVEGCTILQMFDCNQGLSTLIPSEDGGNEWLGNIQFDEVISITGATRQTHFQKRLNRVLGLCGIKQLQRRLLSPDIIKLVLQKVSGAMQ